MQRASEIGQRNHEYVQVKGRFTIDLFRPTSRPITHALVLLDGALRECVEEANAQVINPSLYGLFDIPQINQVYVFYRAELAEPVFGPSSESSEVALFDEADIPWSELAFPVVELALDHYLRDRQTGEYEVKHEQIARPWRSRRA